MSAWLVLGLVASALGAISAHRLITRVLWLAATSIMLALLLATVGAPIVAVVEVSVGAGLVAVLFIFTVGIAGDEGVQGRPVVPKPLAFVVTGSAVLLLLWLILPVAPTSGAESVGPAMRGLADVLWQDRAADLLGQAALIVVAALAVRTILGSSRAAAPVPAPGAHDHRQDSRRDVASTARPAAVAAIPTARAAAEPVRPAGEADGAREKVRT